MCVGCRRGVCALVQIGPTIKEPPSATVRLLNPNGAQLSLRNDLRTPFCAWLCHSASATVAAADGTSARSSANTDQLGLEGMRRYEVAQVHVQLPAGGPAALHELADIDIVEAPGEEGGGARSVEENVLADAEVIRAAVAVVRGIALTDGCSLAVRVSHMSLLSAAVNHVGVEPQHQRAFLWELSRLMLENPSGESRRPEWPNLCARLRAHGLPKSILGRCKPLALQGPDDSAQVCDWLATALPLAATQQPHVRLGLKEVPALLSHLAVWGLPTGAAGVGLSSGSGCPVTVTVDPFMPPPATYYRGLTFQLFLSLPVAVSALESKPAPALVCHGGRYDALMHALWPPRLHDAGIPPLRGCGCTINVDRLTQIASRLRVARMLPADAPVQRVLSLSEVLVCSRGGGGMLRERMEVLRELWGAGVAAETMHRTCPSAQEQYQFAHARGIRALVFVLPDLFTHNQRVKVRLHLLSRVSTGACMQVLDGTRPVVAPRMLSNGGLALLWLQVKLLERRGEESVAVTELPTYLAQALSRAPSAMRRRLQAL
jgi:eukaryotic translation initiation factor 2-alpha kinase 4